MSYVSGFMMGAAIGKSIRQAMAGGGVVKGRPVAAVKKMMAAAKCPAVSGLQLVSALPGRRRYRAACISPELGMVLEEKLSKLAYVKSVEINAVSGSLLLTFEAKDEAQVDRLAKWLENRIFSSQTAKCHKRGEGSAAGEAHAGSITRSIRNTTRAFSQWIKDHTCGWFDISSLASLLFLLRGLRKMLLTGQYPSGSQMLWWAVTLMRGWRTV